MARSWPASALVLDEFNELKDWSASSSEGARVEIAHDTGRIGMGMRVDFDLHAGGYIIVRKAFPLTLPPNYAFTFALHGEAPANNFEFKLVDRKGENVWWYKQRDFHFPADWRQIIIKKARFEFAWGPAGGGVPKDIGFIELAISAGAGGKGSIWIDDLQLEEREAPPRVEPRPLVTASTFAPGHEPGRIFDQDPQSSWHSGALAPDQWLLIDFRRLREYGGLVVDWDREDYATAYQVQVSDDGAQWNPVYSSTMGHGARDYIYTPDGESRYIRLDLHHSSSGQGYGIQAVTVEPFSFSASLNQFFESIAKDAPVGTYPKYFTGKQTYWTIVGVNGDEKEALLNEEGMLEVDKGSFSIEPFLYAEGNLITWSTVHPTQELAQGYLPIPTVEWHNQQAVLRVTAFAGGTAGASILYATYDVQNTSAQEHAIDLFLAIRPFQVLPPWQSLNMVGGVTPIRDLSFDNRTVLVNRDKAVLSLTPPDRFGAAAFEQGAVTDLFAADTMPSRLQVSDPFGYATGVLRYRLRVPPGEHRAVHLAIPFHNMDPALAGLNVEGAAAYVGRQLQETTRYWERTLGHVDMQLPPEAGPIAQTLKSTLAYILINRAGPAIQPGPRNYARSWIRDGAMISAALLEMGFTEEVRSFIRWFAQYQFPDGRIPCCVDHRGADPVPENDSNGEFVFAVAEYYRFTHDVGFLNEMWPTVVRTVEFIASQRQQDMTEPYKQPDKIMFYGLLPESISHEGYSSHPEHSYWDDFFALRGLKDATNLAAVVGDEEHASAFAALRDAFRTDLYASIERSMAVHKIDYIPGSAELGDFDATSTAIALTFGGEQAHLPEPALTHTFDQYYADVQQREHASGGADGYTPYELRNVAAFVRLGQRARAFEILNLLLEGRRPAAWNEWAEVVWHDPEAPRFIGDMPHTWVGSGYVTSVRTMFVYERDADRALVIAAGVPLEWAMSDAGVRVKRLPTYYGILSLSLHREPPNGLRLTLSGDLSVPPGNLVLQPPLPQPLKAVTVNGQPIQSFGADSVTIAEFPADVLLQW